MIERASRTVTAERVEPGDLVMREGKLLTVATTTIGADAVVLVGKLPGRDKGTTKMQVNRGADVELVAGESTLDELEWVVVSALAGEPSPYGELGGQVEHDDRWHFVVSLGPDSVEWEVALRDRPVTVTTEVGSFTPSPTQVNA